MHDVTIELDGETETAVRVPGEHPVVERRLAFECASGDVIERSYTGVPAEAVFGAVDLPPEMTHVRVTARDGHAVCLAIGDVLDGLLAVEGTDAPRFVGPGIAGPRAIKRVSEMEAIALSPEEDPESYERVPPDSK